MTGVSVKRQPAIELVLRCRYRKPTAKWPISAETFRPTYNVLSADNDPTPLESKIQTEIESLNPKIGISKSKRWLRLRWYST